MNFETGKSILENLKQRLVSPFSGALLVSWILWNFKAVLLVLFDEPDMGIVSKLDYINFDLYHCDLCKFSQLYIFPLISAFFFVWAYPWLTNKAHKKSIEYKVQKHNETVAVEKKLTLTQEEVDEITKHWADRVESRENKIKDRESEISDLNSQLELLRRKLGDSEAKRVLEQSDGNFSDKVEKEFNPLKFMDGTESDEEVIINKIKSKKYIPALEAVLTSAANKEFISISAPINYFSSLGLIELERKSNNSAVYSLTTLGKSVQKYYAINY